MGKIKTAEEWSKHKLKTLGASNMSKGERAEFDYYATDPRAIAPLLEREDFGNVVYEPAVGQGHLAIEIARSGRKVLSTDIKHRPSYNGDIFVYKFVGVLDFLKAEKKHLKYVLGDDVDDFDIITNPPYNLATEFIYKSLEVIPQGRKVVMLLRIQFLESIKRKKLFEETPLKAIYVFSDRVNCAINGNPEGFRGSSAICYA